MAPNIIDMYQGDGREAVPDFVGLKRMGIFGVVHRVTEGVNFFDKLYTPRRQAAIDAGLLFGGYHIMTATDVDRQLEAFITRANADVETLLAVDYSRSTSTPALHQCLDFMSGVDGASPGTVSCVLFSADLIRSSLFISPGGFVSSATSGAEIFFAQHRLWLDEIGPHANIPWPWRDKALSSIWQQPFIWKTNPVGRVNPLVGSTGLYCYPDTAENLKANWPSLVSATPNPAIGG